LIRAADFNVRREQKPHIVVFVGPTGSGKTTTIAKLASRWALDDRLKLGLITTDTFRVAAVDQIREYATLLGLELRVAFSAGEAARAAKAFADRDVILVDTAGRNHYDQASLTGLRGVLQGMGTVTVMLVVPATMDRCQVAGMMQNFQVLSPDYLVITKVDETHRPDLLTVTAFESACPVAYLTNGQRVPQDLCGARSVDLAAMLVPEEK
jgi:flagellar biosynthesis protein FlhF